VKVEQEMLCERRRGPKGQKRRFGRGIKKKEKRAKYLQLWKVVGEGGQKTHNESSGKKKNTDW